MPNWSPKDPSDTADYWLLWDGFLADGETITTATVTAAAGLTNVEDDFTATAQRVRLSGGAADTRYDVTFAVVTSTGQQFEITKSLQVRDRTK